MYHPYGLYLVSSCTPPCAPMDVVGTALEHAMLHLRWLFKYTVYVIFIYIRVTRS